MNKYTPITTHDQLVEALRRGLTVEINSKTNESAADYQAPRGGWVGGLPAVADAADDPDSYAWRGFAFRAVGEHDLSPAQPEPKPLTNADLNPGEHDLSLAQPEPKPLTNADLNPGDIVRFRGKEWRVQGIDDNDPNAGLLLLDVTEPKDAPDFVDAVYVVTRGSNRRPENGPGRSHRWCWGHAKKAELVSRGKPEPEPEPEASDSEPAEGVGTAGRPPAFHISVTIHAATPEGYVVALETLARGVEL